MHQRKRQPQCQRGVRSRAINQDREGGIYDFETEEHVHEEEMEVERTEEEEHVEKDLHSTGRGKRQLPPEVASRPQSSKKLCATSDQYAGCVYERAEELFVHGDDTRAVEESAGLTKATHGAEAEELSVAESTLVVDWWLTGD